MANDGAQLERLALQSLNVDGNLHDFHQIMSDAKAISFLKSTLIVSNISMDYFIPNRLCNVTCQFFR
jgi:hypothetical protein